LSFESILIDPLRVIIAITLIRILIQTDIQPFDSSLNIFLTFSIASLLGIIIGFFWSLILHRIRQGPYNYLLTLAALFPVYYIGENFAGLGGGTIIVFVFALVLANHYYFTKRFGFRLRIDTQKLKDFNDQVSFLMKSYFFFYIGIITTINLNFFIIGATITAAIILLRYIIANEIGHLFNFTFSERIISSLNIPLDISAIVFSQLPLIYDPEQKAITNPELYSNIVFVAVLGTLIFTSIISPRLIKLRLKKYIEKQK